MPTLTERRAIVGGVAFGVALMSLALPYPSEARPKRKAETTDIAPPPPALIDQAAAIWGQLPLRHGPTPPGLAHESAQACAACHPHVVAEWAASAHAGPPSAALLDAARTVDDARCVSCHLPLTDQWSQLPGQTTLNADYDATLHSEGVTCAACHIRDGVVHAARARPVAPAPHALAWTASLTGPEACAACHQLTLPNASDALYDTVGEWQRSPWAAAGVTCIDCHGGAMPNGLSTASHALRPSGSQGLTVLIDLPSSRLTRREKPWLASVRLLNTGAGHSLPTGSPFIWWNVEMSLVGPAPETGERPRIALTSRTLSRTLAAEAPYAVLADTRIPAGSGVTIDWALPLTHDLAAGAWQAEVVVRAARVGAASEQVLYATNVPLWVE